MGGNLRLFSQTLLEGGNVKVGDTQAQAIDMSKIDRQKFVRELVQQLLTLNKTFQKEYGFKIWDNEKYVTSGKAFSGSSEHFINLDLSDSEYAKFKKKTGDIDIQMSDQLEKQMHAFFKKHKTFGTMKYLGQSQSAVGQISALMAFKGINIQIDFEFVEVGLNGMPTAFSHWSRSSAWSDIEKGVKGVFHKFAVANLDHAFTKEILLQKGKRKPVVTKETVHLFAFSVKNGLRPKYRLLDPKKKIFEPIPAKEGKYTKDIPEIFKILFKKKGSSKDIKNFNSFTGIVDMVKKYFNKTQQKKFVLAFVEFIWGVRAQKLYRDDPVTDNTMKSAAYDYIEKTLGFPKKSYSKMINLYYKGY